MRRLLTLLAVISVGACARHAKAPNRPVPMQVNRNEQQPPQLPDSTGWGVHILALKRAPHGNLWAGTYGRGMYVLRGDSVRRWHHFAPVRSGDTASLGALTVNSIAVVSDSVVWYGTVGNGFGVTRDGGQTWRSWDAQLGKQWRYIAPDGVVVRGDTTYIATADGLRITRDRGATWRCIQAAGSGNAGGECNETVHSLPSQYLLSMDVGNDGAIWVGHLKGVSVSRDGGMTWSSTSGAGLDGRRVRALRVAADSTIWAATEDSVFTDTAANAFLPARILIPGMTRAGAGVRDFVQGASDIPPAILTSSGMIARELGDQFRIYFLPAGEIYRPSADLWSMVWVGPPYWPIGASATGLNRVLAGETPTRPTDIVPAASPPAAPLHALLQRPIAATEGNPYIDATHLFGTGTTREPRENTGVELNNPAGTPVHAVADGVIVFAGASADGSNNVIERSNSRESNQDVYATYGHNSALLVRAGQLVQRGDVIARVGNSGATENERLHFEVLLAAPADAASIAAGKLSAARNPALWMTPMPGTGIVAGRVTDSAGNPVQGAHIYGFLQTYPEETPFSFITTYRGEMHSDPAYNENFAVGDISAGDYVAGVDIGGVRVWRRVHVTAGLVTFVEFTAAK